MKHIPLTHQQPPQHQLAATGLELQCSDVGLGQFGNHVHLEYHLGIVSRGVQLFSTRAGTQPLSVGQVALLNPDVVHDGVSVQQANQPRQQGYCLHVIRLEPEYFSQLLQQLGYRPGLAWLPDQVINDRALYQRLLALHRLQARQTQQIQDRAADQALAFEPLWLDTLDYLVEHHSEAQPRQQALSADCKSKLTVQQLDRLRDFLLADLTAKHDLAELGALFGLSRYQFLRRFQAATGMTPHAYLMQLRLESARLLLRRDSTMAEVAAQVGFFDQSHFIHAFRRANGLTPAQYCALL